MNNKVVYSWCIDGVPFYIGIGTPKRPYSLKGRNQYCLNVREQAIEQNSFSIEILYTKLTHKEACEKECKLIYLYGRRDNGTGCLTNMTDGGDGRTNSITSVETRNILSKKAKGNTNSINNKGRTGLQHTKETKKKLRDLNSGSSHPFFGRKHTKETRDKQSQSKQGNRNYKSKQVHTPFGIFDSVRECERFTGIRHCTIVYRAKRDSFPDWYYSDG